MEAIKGSRIIYLYRIYGQKYAAKNMAFVTENSRTISKDADSTDTKDGAIRTPAEAEIEISTTSLLAKGDTLIDELEQACKNGDLIEIWEVNLDEPSASSNKFKGTYYQGYLTSFEKSSPADSFVECSLDFGINGNGADGDVTVTKEQQDMAIYVFEDTVAKS